MILDPHGRKWLAAAAIVVALLGAMGTTRPTLQAQTEDEFFIFVPVTLCERCREGVERPTLRPSPTATRQPRSTATATNTAIPSPSVVASTTPAPVTPPPSATPLLPSPTSAVTPTGCEKLQRAFADYADLTEVDCDETHGHVHTETGLPDPNPATEADRMMVGITNWILRMPVPFTYRWRIPLEPAWLDEPEEASPRGPIAFAVDGVPIFHYERRPDVPTDPELYDPRNDTVLQGELDQCGGHAGQGEDYHYHYAPVCLMDDHDVEQPIAFGLDGVAVYFGTGGDDYYGRGRYSDIDNLPEDGLDKCNAHALEEGGYVYYTTNDPPYTIGCHVAHADPRLRIEPRPLKGRNQGDDAPYGGRVGEPMDTLVTDSFIDSEGWRHLVHEAFTGGGHSATLIRASERSGDCWDFEFRADADVPGSQETYCR